MSILHALVLGLTQGLSEFLPVSSSGHLLLVPWIFGWNDFSGNVGLEKSFDVALHLGTLIAALSYFAPDVWRYIKAAVDSIKRRKVDTNDAHMAWLLLVASIPGAAIGALFESTIEEHLGRIWLIAVMLITFGLVLGLADRAKGTRTAEDFRIRDAVIMGAAQALALQPGVSRSGATITAGRFSNFSREAAVRLSFLMGLPIIGGAVLYKGAKLVAGDGIPADARAAFVVGIIASAVSGFAAVAGLLRLVRSNSLAPFVIYRVATGIAVLIVLATTFR